MQYVTIVLTFIFVENIVLFRLLGLCPFARASKNLDSAVGLGLAVTWVMALSSLAGWLINTAILVPLHLEFLDVITFVMAILGLVRLMEFVVKRTSSVLDRLIGDYLPLIATNCAVLGIALIVVGRQFNGLESFVAGIAAGIGFLLVMLIMSTLREKLDLELVPRPFRGVSIAFISAGLMALAFLAFDRTLLRNLMG